MSIPFEIEQRRPEIEAEIAKLGAELIELQFRHVGGRSVLTLIVDRPGGVTLDECVRINHRIGEWLDELSSQYEPGTDFLKGSYFLEVNSPGLDRPLRTPRDFERAAGQSVRVIWRNVAGGTYTTIGVLASSGADSVTIRPAGRDEITIPLESVVKATRDVGFGR
jgi:ribosome maturation factor RimP